MTLDLLLPVCSSQVQVLNNETGRISNVQGLWALTGAASSLSLSPALLELLELPAQGEQMMWCK